MDKKEFDRQVQESAELGLSLVGPQKALQAALMAQLAMTHMLLKLINGVVDHARKNGREPVLPLTDEVLEVHNNVVGACALTGAILKMSREPEYRTANDNQDHHGPFSVH